MNERSVHTVLKLDFEQRQRANKIIEACSDCDDQFYLLVHEHVAMGDALTDLLDHYTQLVNSGDAGNWDPEKEPVVIAARAVLNGCELQTDEDVSK